MKVFWAKMDCFDEKKVALMLCFMAGVKKVVGCDCALSGLRLRTLGVATAHSRGCDCALSEL